jgi:hypothetical protein
VSPGLDKTELWLPLDWYREVAYHVLNVTGYVGYYHEFCNPFVVVFFPVERRLNFSYVQGPLVYVSRGLLQPKYRKCAGFKSMFMLSNELKFSACMNRLQQILFTD